MKNVQNLYRDLCGTLNEMCNAHGLQLSDVSVQWIDTSTVEQNSAMVQNIDINRGKLFYVPEEKP